METGMVLYRGRREKECEIEESKMKKQKADISLGATEKEREDVVRRYLKIQKLLKHFGVEAYAFDPGVRCMIPEVGKSRGYYKEGTLDFGEYEWKWLEPLLRELLRYRRKYESSSKRL